MDYIVIKNRNNIVNEDLTLIGSSTKRGDDSKIGMFGSGWKYALAWFLRNNCHVKIFAGTREIMIKTKPILHRDTVVNVVTVDGIPTSITTEMGIKWDGWMAIREVVSNAIDEGNYQVEIDGSLQPEEGYTTVYIGSNRELEEVMYNFNTYFAFKRPNGIVIEYGSDRSATFYKRASVGETMIYRKGIKCFNKFQNSLFDVDFSHIEINESRLTDSWYIRNELCKVINSENLTFDILEIMLASFIENDSYEIKSIFSGSPTNHIGKLLAKAVKDKYVVVSDIYIKLFGAGRFLGNKLIIIPSSWYSSLVAESVIEDHLNIFLGKDHPHDFIKGTAKFDVNKVHQYVSHIKDMKIIPGKFASSSEMIRIVEDEYVYIDKDFSYRPSVIASRICARMSTNIFESLFANMIVE